MLRAGCIVHATVLISTCVISHTFIVRRMTMIESDAQTPDFRSPGCNCAESSTSAAARACHAASWIPVIE